MIGILLLLLIIVESISEVLIRCSITGKPLGVVKNKSTQLILGLLGYVILGLLFYQFLKYFKGSFAYANSIWIIGNVIIITLVSIFLFDTKLNYIQWLGFFFLILGLILFGMEKNESYLSRL